ncbi:MAG: hypothetical protein IIB78_08305 [Proteobacteria bacterium]|nr:hypothetical protein [Pseudomonadota bacterium]
MSLYVRRVVTGHDENGRARVIIDEISKTVVSRRPGQESTVVWATDHMPPRLGDDRDISPEIETTTIDNGIVFRIGKFSPGVAARVHRTAAIDYAAIISGEIAMELERIARTGEPVPGQTEGAAFTVFSNPIIDRDGRVAFWAGYESGAGDGGLYVYQDGMVERVLDDNPANTGEVPGADDGDYFGDFEITADGDAPGFSWGIGDRLIISAETRGPSRTNGIYRWRASDGAMKRRRLCTVSPRLLARRLEPGEATASLTLSSKASFGSCSGNWSSKSGI